MSTQFIRTPSSMVAGDSLMQGITGFSDDFYAASSWQANEQRTLWYDVGAAGNRTTSPSTDGIELTANGVIGVDTSGSGIEYGIRTHGNTLRLVRGKKLWFGARIALEDYDGQDFFIGLAPGANSNNSIIDDLPNSYFGFLNEDQTAHQEIDIASASASTSATTRTTTTAKFSANEAWLVLTMEYDGKERLSYYADKLLVGSITSNLPYGVGMSVFMTTLASAAARFIYADYIYCFMER